MGNYKRLQGEKRVDLEQVLSAQELGEYDLRLSPAAATLRSKLGSVNVSEMEFREMVGIRRKFDEEFCGMAGMDARDPEAQARRDAGQHKQDEQILRILGPRRFADFQRHESDAHFERGHGGTSGQI